MKVIFQPTAPSPPRRVTYIEGGKSLAMEVGKTIDIRGNEYPRTEWREVNHVTRGEWYELAPTPEEVFEFAREVLGDDERWHEVDVLIAEGLA